jgi:hypothetical protein
VWSEQFPNFKLLNFAANRKIVLSTTAQQGNTPSNTEQRSEDTQHQLTTRSFLETATSHGTIDASRIYTFSHFSQSTKALGGTLSLQDSQANHCPCNFQSPPLYRTFCSQSQEVARHVVQRSPLHSAPTPGLAHTTTLLFKLTLSL